MQTDAMSAGPERVCEPVRTTTIAFTPPLTSREPTGPVARRLLFYVPGYDPDSERRYRTLFLREIGRYAKVFGVPMPKVGCPTVSEDGNRQSWVVETGGGRTRTEYELLLWSDLVRRDMGKPRVVGIGLNAWATLNFAVNGTLAGLYRTSWKCANVMVYPFVGSLLLLMALLVASFAGHGVLHHGFGLPGWFALLAGIVASLVGLRFLAPRLDRAFLWQLMHDCVFHWQHACGKRPDYDARVEAFTAHMRARIRESQADEVMIVGHSTGGLTAVELAVRLLAEDPTLGEAGGPVLSLLTLGSCLPIVALQPDARATRAAVAQLVTSRRLTWVDFQAPQDWMNFPGFNPARDLPLGLSEGEMANPIIRSAKFAEIINRQTYERIRLRPFRMHFQFLMANDHAGVFDIFALTLGPRSLRDRVLSEDTSLLDAPATA